MDALLINRKALRTVFTKRINGLLELLKAENVDYSTIHSQFLVLEKHYTKLSGLDSDILTYLCKDNDEIKLESEIEKADEYSAKYFLVESKIKEVEVKNNQVTTASVCAHNDTLAVRLPRLELVKYNGDISAWISFWAQFSSIDRNLNISNEEKFQYLIQATESRARTVVDSFPPSGENYPKAVRCLKERFGRDDLLIEYYIRELWKLVSTNRTMDLSSLYDRLIAQLRALETLNVITDNFAAILLPMVESCIPSDLLRIWQRSNSDSAAALKVQMDSLLEFLKREVASNERVVLARESTARDGHKNDATPKSDRLATATNLSNIQKSAVNCIFCDKPHDSTECYRAQEMSLEEKLQILTKENRCFGCTKSGHLSRGCRAKCVICKGRHIPLMCSRNTTFKHKTNKPFISDSKEVDLLTTTDLNLSASSSRDIYLQTFLVWVRNESKGRKARVLIDCGSQRSYIKSSLVTEMGYNALGKEDIIHTLFGGRTTGNVRHSIFKVHLSSLSGNYTCCFNALDQENIASNIPTVSAHGAWRTELDHYHIKIAPDTNDPIEILLGADVAGKLWTGGRKVLSFGLVAIETHFGWSLMGSSNSPATVLGTNVANIVTMLNIKSSDVSGLWRLDVIGIEDPVEKKKNEERQNEVLEEFERGVRYVDGRYEVRLPWKMDRVELPSNKEIARGRLMRCTHKLKGCGSLFSEYDSIIQEWFKEGIVEKTGAGTGYFLPHRPVVKESSATTKVRPVFDASAKIEGFPSLNDCLEEGPNLIELLHVVLMRFREKSIGITADIKKAFLQISIHPKDRDCLKFLWWEKNGRDNEKLETYRHTRVVFGVSSSPFLLAATLNHHLNKSMDGASDQFKNTIKLLKKGFYVDNLAISLDEGEDVERFKEESCNVLSKAGFELRGWEFSYEDNSVSTSILGIKWNKREDILKLNIDWGECFIISEVYTKRHVFSVCQRIFDPIGVSVPATLCMKLLVQSLWERKLDWDEPLDEETQRTFRSWLKEMPLLGEIKVNRYLGSRTNISLHLFCDGSKKAYAAAVFVRSVCNDQIQVELVHAKSRVAPLKNISIPRLELMAATIGVRILKVVQEALHWSDVPVYLWTDSSTVLAWIQRREEWSIFVRNRVKEIRELSPTHRWRHVSGQYNPADLPSRGCTPSKLLKSKWWEGPAWLKMNEAEWPSTIVDYEEEKISEERLKTSTNLMMITQDHTWLYNYFSKFEKILRMVAWMARFWDNCRSKNNKRTGALSLQELIAAEMTVFRCIQEETLMSIKDERIVHLRPYIDPCGIIRIKTKLENRIDEPTFRSPAVLPGNHPVIERMFYDLHCKSHHVGTQTLQSLIRERCWVIKGRLTARQTVKNCVICRRFNAKNFDTESPALPEPRVRDGLAFEVTGVDLAGPLLLRDDGKVWIGLFTCAVYRAVHLELVHSLSTESFVSALRRFIARRGRPSIIYSDNGTNFRGAANVFSAIDWDKISAYSTAERIDWRFNPPTAAWWGGFWERLVGTVKQLLRRTLRKAALNLEELQTVLCDCEAMVNSRPLTPVSDSDTDPVPLTPAMFLQGVQQCNVPDCDNFERNSLSRRLKYRQRLRESLKLRFRREYLGLLKWSKRNITREPEIGEVVLLGNENEKRMDWPLAVVEAIIRGTDGKVRVLYLRTSSGRCYRPIQRVFPLEVSSTSNVSEKRATEEDILDIQEKAEDPVTSTEMRTRTGRRVVAPLKLDL